MDSNPILNADFPDPDVIRVGDTYYMVSTTMHFMPGAVILRSFDLIHWEIHSYVYETLDGTPAQRMQGDGSIYGQGMWAASLRYSSGEYYVCFAANDTGKTYLYRAKDLRGPWIKQNIQGFYHDCSLLFDDGRAYIVYGNTDIRLTELNDALTGPKEGGLQRVIVRDAKDRRLGYEGSHFYRINGRYYLFLIHWLSDGSGRRVEACFRSDSLTGRFEGKDVLDDDLGYRNMGVAQGGIVDTPDGEWFGVFFQDRGAAGRMPVLVPMRWEGDSPVFGVGGKVPRRLETKSARPGHSYAPFVSSDDFSYFPDESGRIRLDRAWQWNHEPDDALWSVDGERGSLRIASGRLCKNVTRAINVLTQRTVWPACSASVRMDGSRLCDGDYAGLCALQGRYGMVAIAKERGDYFLVMQGKPGKADNAMGRTRDESPGMEYARIPWPRADAALKVSMRFEEMIDEAIFYYLDGSEWKTLGVRQKLYFGLDHFAGCRFGLFMYSTKETGGEAGFGRFAYDQGEEEGQGAGW
jgi:beta-xylosidase